KDQPSVGRSREPIRKIPPTVAEPPSLVGSWQPLPPITSLVVSLTDRDYVTVAKGSEDPTGPMPAVTAGHTAAAAEAARPSSGNPGSGLLAVVPNLGLLGKPLHAVGGFFAMALDTFVLMVRPPFAWREYLLQTWFVARVSVLPAVMMTIP